MTSRYCSFASSDPALLLFLSTLMFSPVAAIAQATPVPVAEAAQAQAVGEAWWTGPLIASSAETLPRDHVLVEPYLFNVRAGNSDYIGSLTYLLYGATDNLTLGFIPTFGASRPDHAKPRGSVGIGDLTVSAQYRLHHSAPGAIVPSISLVAQRIVPLGRFDRLQGKPETGIGSGTATTLVGVYFQRIDRIASGRPLRTRVNLTHTFGARVALRDDSVYGTSSGFRGSAGVGAVTVFDLSIEYSLSRRLVIASDFNYRHTGSIAVLGNAADPTSYRADIAATSSFSFAPAIEYSWAVDRGALIGVRVTPRHNGSSTSWTPVVAFNAYF